MFLKYNSSIFTLRNSEKQKELDFKRKEGLFLIVYKIKCMDKPKEVMSIIQNVDVLLRSVQASHECLAFDVKRIKPCVDVLQNLPNQDVEDTLVVKDMVNRLMTADEKLSEAVYLIGEALSSVAIGNKNFKETVRTSNDCPVKE